MKYQKKTIIKKYKTINQVIRKGQLVINVPVTIIMVVVPILLTYGIPTLFPKEQKGLGLLIGLFLGLGLGFILAWIWWSFRIVKWRIWAFENTKKSDWKALKRKAITGKLIWKDGNRFEKTEIRNASEKRKIEKFNCVVKELEEEENSRIIEDDSSIPIRIDFYFKRSETVLSLIVPIVFIGMGFFLLIEDNLMIGLIGIGFAIYMIDLNKISNIVKREIQFHISNEGIYMKQFNQFGLIKWTSTQDISIDMEYKILNFVTREKNKLEQVTLNLNEYQIDNHEAFLNKINVYLKRNSRKKVITKN